MATRAPKTQLAPRGMLALRHAAGSGIMISNDLHRLRGAGDSASLRWRPQCAADAEPCGVQLVVMATRLDRQSAPDNAVAGALRELGGAAAADEHPHESREP